MRCVKADTRFRLWINPLNSIQLDNVPEICFGIINEPIGTVAFNNSAIKINSIINQSTIQPPLTIRYSN